MGKKFIPSSRRDNSRSLTLCLRPFGQSCDALGVRPRLPQLGWPDLRCTIYDLRAVRAGGHLPSFRNRKSQIVNHKSTRRVMGAWWPSRSSKPPLARFTGRGVFDSLPLRQLHLRFTIYDLRFALNLPARSDHDSSPSSSFVLVFDTLAFFRARGRRTRTAARPMVLTGYPDHCLFLPLVNHKSQIVNPKGGDATCRASRFLN